MKLSLGLLGVCLSLSLAAAPVRNLPDSFYNRKGLEKMPRLNWEKMPQVNVIDCGADNTGKKLCGPAFDIALKKLAAKGGGVVYIPAGIYRFRNPISDPKRVLDRVAWRSSGLNNIHFVGAGPEKTIIITDYDGVKYNGGQAPYLWSLSKSENISLRDLSFSLFPFFGMRSPRMGEGVFSLAFSGNKGVQVINVTCDQGRIPICFWGGNSDAWVVDCDVRNTGADAIKFDSCTDVVAAYNYIECNNDDGFSGLYMEAGLSKNNAFLYNTLVYNKGWGRGIAISGYSHKVIGNWIESQAMLGLLLHKVGYGKWRPDISSNDWTISENTFVRTDLHCKASNMLIGHRYYGAIAGYVKQDKMIISDNKIFGTASNGINLSRNNKINGLVISGNTIAGNMDAGLIMAPQTDKDYLKNVTLNNNKIVENRDFSFKAKNKIELVKCSGNIIDTPAEIYKNCTLKNDITKVIKKGRDMDMAVINGFELKKAASGYTDMYLAARTMKQPSVQKAPVVSSKGPVIDVKKLGAKGDGKTSDTEAFIKAIAALPKNGGTLNIPAGKYLLDPVNGMDTLPWTCIKHTLVIKDKSNITILGEGEKSVLLFPSMNHEGLRLIGLENIAVRNLTLKMTGKSYHRKNRTPLDVVACENVVLNEITSLDSIGYGLRFDACTSVLIDNCEVKNANQIGINILGGWQVTVRNNRIVNTRDHGIHIGCIGGIARFPMFIDIISNVVDGTREGQGISLCYGTELKVADNKVSNAYQAGIAAYYVNAIFPLEKLLITGNTVTNCAFGKLSYMRGAITCFNVSGTARRKKGRFMPVITGNTIDSTAANGIWIYKSDVGKRAIVKDNVFKNVKLKDVVIDDAVTKPKKK